MQKIINKVLSLPFILAVSLMLSAGSFPASAMPAEPTAAVTQPESTSVPETSGDGEEKLIIVHTNDVHTYVAVEPYVKGYVDARRAEGEQVWLLSAGDAFAGSVFGTLSNGLDAVTVMNMVGYEAMVLGNNDHLIEKSGYLGPAVAAANFPVLSVNAPKSFTDAVPGVKPYLIYEFGDIRIAMIGLGAYGGLDAYEGAFVTGDQMIAAAEAAKAQAEAEGASVFIGLSHLGFNDPDESLRGTYIADHCPWFEVLVEGHCHTVLAEGMIRNGVLLTETGEYGNNIGVIELTFKNGEIVEKKAGIIPIAGNEETCGITPDPEIAAFIAKRETENAIYLNEVLGQIPEDMTSNRNVVRKEEAALGNLITDAFRWKTGADFATFNGSGIRVDLTQGNFTRELLLSLFLNRNPVITVQVDGDYIYNWMEKSVSNYPELNPYFKQVSGLIVEFDSTKASGERIVSITLADGTPIKRNGTYIHATDGEPDFYLDTVGKENPVEGVDFQSGYGSFQEIFIEYINSGEMFDHSVSGRIKEINEN